MLFYVFCILSGFLIQRVVKSKWAYLLSPVGAFISSLVSALAVYVFASLAGKDADGKDMVFQVAMETSLGSLFVAFSLWYFRSRNTQALVLMIAFGIYVILLPALTVSFKEDFNFLSDPQTRAKLFYSSLYSMFGSLLASLILLIPACYINRAFFTFLVFSLFSICPLAVRFFDSQLGITGASSTALWVQANTLSYSAMLVLTIPVSMLLTFVIRKFDRNA